jgi:hypothetical protein
MDITSRINSALALTLAGIALVSIGITDYRVLFYVGAFFVGFGASQLFEEVRFLIKERRLQKKI